MLLGTPATLPPLPRAENDLAWQLQVLGEMPGSAIIPEVPTGEQHPGVREGKWLD